MLSEHPYLYCEHEPVNSVDPSGYRPFKDYWDWFWGGIGANIGGDIGGVVAGPPGERIGIGLGGAVGVWIGDQIWEGGEQLYDIVKDAWTGLRGKLEKLTMYNAMLDELGL